MKIRTTANEIYAITLSILVLLSCYRIAVGGSLWTITLLVSIGMLFVEILGKKYVPSKVALLLCIFFMIGFASTVLNHGISISFIRMYLTPLTYVLWCDMYAKEHMKIFLTSHVIVISILCVVQLYFQIIDPDIFGVSNSNNMMNLFVSDNFMGYYLVPFLVLVFISSCSLKGEISAFPWIMTAICVYSIVISGAGACTLGICFFAAMMIILLMLKKKIKLNIYFVYAIYIAFFLGIVVFSVQNFFADFLMNTIGKNTSLTGRIYIWAEIPSYFMKKPWLGYGIDTDGTADVIFVKSGGYNVSGKSWHAHNYFFEILICGGLLQMIPYICVLWEISRSIIKCKNRMISNIIVLGILSMFIMYISEGFLLQPAQYLIYILAYYSPKFSEASSVACVTKRRKLLRVRFKVRHRLYNTRI